MKSAWLEWRMLMAERLILLAITVAPHRHPHFALMARHLHALAVETGDTLRRERGAP